MLCIFFSKQKTAYEWRISDWSSDVCSSDLGQLHRDQGLAAGDEVATHAKARGVAADAACVEAGGARQLLEAPRDRLGMQAAADPAGIVDAAEDRALRNPGAPEPRAERPAGDRKSTRLNTRHKCASRKQSSA